MSPISERRRRIAWLAVASGIAALTACGGGFYIGIGDDGWDDPPTVSLVVSSNSAAPGDVLRLAAAASDDFGVDRVQFYRIERDGGATLLGTDRVEPFDWDTTMPATSTAEVRYFARAIDGAGQATDSATAAVAASH